MKPDSLSFLTLISSIVHFGLVDRLVSFAAVIRVVTHATLERCVTTLITLAKETIDRLDGQCFVHHFRFWHKFV